MQKELVSKLLSEKYFLLWLERWSITGTISLATSLRILSGSLYVFADAWRVGVYMHETLGMMNLCRFFVFF